MGKRIKIVIISLFGLFVFLVLFIGLEKSNNYSPDNILAKVETKISAKSLYKKNEISLDELIDNKKFLLINVWASWCLPCRNEHAYLVNLQKNENIKIIGINYKDNENNAKKFLEDLGNPYSEILVDKDGTKSIELGAYGVPETYLVDSKTKEILKKYIGPIDDSKFTEIIEIVKNEKI